jgi:putative spermidine/putrescine transport system permease protein
VNALYHRYRILLLLSPALLVIGVIFGGGLFVALLRSFNYMPVLGRTEPNLDAYRAIFSSADTYRSFALSFYIAFTSTLLSAIVAVAAALLVRQKTFGRTLINFLFRLNLTVPHVVGAVGMLYLVSQSGSFARIAARAALIDQPSGFPALVFDPCAIGIILEYVWKEVPFISLIILASMQTIGEDYEAVARSLGATAWQSIRHILLPLIQPSLLSASAIVFAFSFGAYEVPALLGKSYPLAMPVVAYRKYTDVDLASRTDAMALAVVIAVLAALMLVIFRRALRQYCRT